MAFLLYSAQRVLILLAVAGALYLIGLRDLLLWVLAFLVSGALSLVLLRGSRDAMSASLVARSRRDADIDTSEESEAIAHPDRAEGPSAGQDDAQADQDGGQHLR